jgi:hypothetical protein
VIYAIDPGTTQSALVTLHPDGRVEGRNYKNDVLAIILNDCGKLRCHLVIESIESYGMPVGLETFETVYWSGRFAQAWDMSEGHALSKLSRIGRKAVKLHLCGSLKAKDANIRQALIDKYGGIACTKKGGALHGITSHLWAALAVAVTYRDTCGDPARPAGEDA